jgi:hypothetical protein
MTIWGWILSWTVLAAGMRLGRRGLPHDTHYRWVSHHETHESTKHAGDPRGIKLHFQEAEFVDRANERIAEICERWRRSKEKFDGECHALWAALTDLLRENQALLTDHVAKRLRDPRRDIPTKLYVPLMTAIAGAELVFNGQAFEVARMQQWEQWVVAIVPSAATFAGAHVLGKHLRQRERGSATTDQWASSLLAVTTLGAVLVGVGALREAYVRLESVPDSRITLGLVAINAACMAGAILISYLAHDADGDLEAISGQRRRLERRLRRARKRWGEISGKYDRARTKARELIHGICERTRREVDQFRRGVAATSPGGRVPEWFGYAVPRSVFRALDHELDVEIGPPPLAIREWLIDDIPTTSGHGNGRLDQGDDDGLFGGAGMPQIDPFTPPDREGHA